MWVEGDHPQLGLPARLAITCQRSLGRVGVTIDPQRTMACQLLIGPTAARVTGASDFGLPLPVSSQSLAVQAVCGGRRKVYPSRPPDVALLKRTENVRARAVREVDPRSALELL